MNLYLVHCGYYDSSVSDGLYESHVNYFVVSDSFENARTQIKSKEEFKNKKMHIDGMQEIQAVDGFKISLEQHVDFVESKTKILNFKHRELAPSPSISPKSYELPNN